jgi:hypothetical protein
MKRLLFALRLMLESAAAPVGRDGPAERDPANSRNLERF